MNEIGIFFIIGLAGIGFLLLANFTRNESCSFVIENTTLELKKQNGHWILIEYQPKKVCHE